MKSSKWIFGLAAIMFVLATAPSSFAQVQLIINNTPSPGEIQTNRNAQTSDPVSTGSGILISGQLLAISPLTTTTLTLSFGAPITSNGFTNNSVGNGAGAAIPPTDPIRIEGNSGVFASVTAITSINFSSGTITITLPCANATVAACGSANNTQSGSFRVVGVRLDVNGKTAPMTVAASLSSSANNYIAPATSSVPTISSLGAGIGSLTQSSLSFTGSVNSGSFLMFTNQTGGAFADAGATIVLAEGFASAWRTSVQVSTNGTTLTNGTDIRLTFTGLPAGVTVTATPAGGSTSGNRPTVDTANSTLAATASSTTPSPTMTIRFLSTNLTTVESLQLALALSGAPTGTLTPGSISVTATHVPIGEALDSTTFSPASPTMTGGYPRFAQADVGPVTIGTIVSATTTLLIPYAVKVGAYDTGIAIANTSADPFGSAGGGATPVSGTIIFTLFPRTDTGAGTSFSLTTSATARPGVGLATDGTLAAGGTWTGLVTDLLTAAGKTGDFFGYIFIQTNFVLAHGASYIFDGRGFTSASPVLVLPPPVSSSRNALGGGVESLNN
jgi:hypothetical protein